MCSLKMLENTLIIDDDEMIERPFNSWKGNKYNETKKIGRYEMRKKILVIDDDEAIRKSFILSFEDSAYRVDTAESGKKGIKMVKKNNYDLIFLDLKMPEMDGVETLKELQRIDNEIPVFIITAFHQEYFEGLKKSEADGIDFNVIQKPIDSEQLHIMVKAILGEPAEY